MAKKTSRSSKLPKGMYELYIHGRKLPLIVQLQAIPVGTVHKELEFNFGESVRDRALKVTNPEEGTDKFFIICSKLSMYTAIGADNRHHAANKATKLFGPGWTSLTRSNHLIQYLEFAPVLMFKELISSL